MPEQNPVTSQIEKLSIELFELYDEHAASSGAEAATIAAEIAAKEKLLDRLLIVQNDWMLGRLQKAVAKLEALAASELARQARVVERLRRLVETYGGSAAPAPAPEADTQPVVGRATEPVAGGGGAPPPGAHVAIEITPTDLESLERVTASEVGHFDKYGQEQFRGAVEAVVETILNRVAHKGFQKSVQAVIDHPFQFSAINATGSWKGLPAAPQALAAVVRDYLERRVAGATGRLGGATHFLNPHFASASALAEWGNYVVDNAVAVFGDNDAHDVHFHGFAPGTSLPRAHAIWFGRWSPVYDGRGQLIGAAPSSGLRAGLIQTLQTERDFFENGKKKEGDTPHCRRVGDYWQALGQPFDGKSDVAWSAAFICWTIMQQGIGPDRFRGHSGHCRYVEDALEGGLPNPLFEVMHPDLRAPETGDLVHYGRAADEKLTFTTAKVKLAADEFYSSHSDFVVEVDRHAGKVITIGGNLSNSVKEKVVRIDDNGLLKPHGSARLPWIAVLRLRDA